MIRRVLAFGVLLALFEGAVAFSSGVESSAAAEPVAPGAFHADPGWFRGDPVVRPAGRVTIAADARPVTAIPRRVSGAGAGTTLGVRGAFFLLLETETAPFRAETAPSRTETPPLPADTASAHIVADTVRIIETRPTPESRIHALPYHASVHAVEGATARMLTIADVLEQAAGVRVRRYGGLGAFAAASIRASSPGQVEIYLDGLPLNSAAWGAPNLADVPIDGLERVEVYRAGAPVGFGAPGIGGVVNLVSRGVARPHLRASAAGGSFGTFRSALVSAGPLGAFQHMLTIHHARSRGDFRFRYDNGTRDVTEDDTEMRRPNNDFRETSVLAKLVPPALGPCRFTIADDFFVKSGGLPGHGDLLYHAAHFDTRRHRVSLSADVPALTEAGAGARFGVRATAFTGRTRDRTFNPARESGLPWGDFTDRTRTSGALARVTLRAPELRQALELAGEWNEERFVPSDPASPGGVGFERRRRTRNAGLEDEIAPFGERFVLLASARWREAGDNFFGPVPFGRPAAARADRHVTRVRGHSVGSRLAITRGFSLKVNRSMDARFPTLFEIFGTGGEVRMNPTLAPERARTWDAGFSWQLGGGGAGTGAPRVTLDVTGFSSRRDSLIVFVQNSQRNFVAQNLERATVKGLEVQLDASLGSRLAIGGAATFEDARQQTAVPQWDGRRVPYSSPQEYSLRTTIRATRRLELRHEYLRCGRYYQDRANLPEGRVPARALHHFGATWRSVAPRGAAPRVSVNVDLENAFDRRVDDVYGYPMPGRTLYATIEASFGRSRDH